MLYNEMFSELLIFLGKMKEVSDARAELKLSKMMASLCLRELHRSNKKHSMFRFSQDQDTIVQLHGDFFQIVSTMEAMLKQSKTKDSDEALSDRSSIGVEDLLNISRLIMKSTTRKPPTPNTDSATRGSFSVSTERGSERSTTTSLMIPTGTAVGNRALRGSTDNKDERSLSHAESTDNGEGVVMDTTCTCRIM